MPRRRAVGKLRKKKNSRGKARKKKSSRGKVELEEALVPVKRSRIWTRREEGSRISPEKKLSFSP